MNAEQMIWHILEHIAKQTAIRIQANCRHCHGTGYETRQELTEDLKGYKITTLWCRCTAIHPRP